MRKSSQVKSDLTWLDLSVFEKDLTWLGIWSYITSQVKSKKILRKNLFFTSILLSNLKILQENIIKNDNYSHGVDVSSNRKRIRIRWKSLSFFIGHLTSQSINFGVTWLEVKNRWLAHLWVRKNRTSNYKRKFLHTITGQFTKMLYPAGLYFWIIYS